MRHHTDTRSDIIDVFVDLENLTPRWWALPAATVRRWVAEVLGALPDEARPVVVACRDLIAVCVAELHAAGATVRTVEPTPSAADRALIGWIDDLPGWVDHIAILSGDGAFIESTRRLVRSGRHVTVVGVADGIHTVLAEAATEVVELTSPWAASRAVERAMVPVGTMAAGGPSTVVLSTAVDRPATDRALLQLLDAQLDTDDVPAHIVCLACRPPAGDTVLTLCQTTVPRSSELPATEVLDVCTSCADARHDHHCN